MFVGVCVLMNAHCLTHTQPANAILNMKAHTSDN